MTLKAFYCYSGWSDAADIVFAGNRNKARWEFINHWCDGDLSDVSIRRARKYDGYGSADAIPVELLIGDGWYFYCQNCDMQMAEDTLEEENIQVSDVIGTLGGPVFCCAACEKKHEERKQRDKRIKDEILRTMQWRLEDIFGRDNISYGEFHLNITYEGNITAMTLPAVVDGIDIQYHNTDSRKKSPEEVKKMKHTLSFPKKHVDHLCEKYGLHPLEK